MLSNVFEYDTAPSASVLFSDIVQFTNWSSQTTPDDIVNTISKIFSEWDNLCEKLKIEKVMTIGDAYFACCGVTIPVQDHAHRICQMALGMLETLEKLNEKYYWDLQIRIGLSSGSVTYGLMGSKKLRFDLFGPTVVNAQLMEKTGVPGRVHLDSEIAKIVKDDFIIEKRNDQIQVINLFQCLTLSERKGRSDRDLFPLKRSKQTNEDSNPRNI